MRVLVAWFALLMLSGTLASCSSSPTPQESGEPTARFDPVKDAYWTDPRWDKIMLTSVQSAVHDPADPADISTPVLQATVKFTYFDGTVEYPEIVQSTGHADLDKLMLQQLASTQIPRPTAGLHTDAPHEFIIDLDMPTPFESFESGVFYAIENWKFYPKEEIIRGTTGDTTVDFDYLDGKASVVTVTQSSKDRGLDKASTDAVIRASFSPTPPAYVGKSLHMEVVFCYTMTNSPYNGKTVRLNACPNGRNVIEVHGFRMQRTGF